MKSTQIYLEPSQIIEHRERYYEVLEELGYPLDTIDEMYEKHIRKNVIIKYSKEWQDKNLQEWCDLILTVPGGYWQAIELMQQPHSEYEHYRFKQKMSYEKGNVSRNRAEIELRNANKIAYYMFHDVDKTDDGVTNVDISGNISLELPKDL